MHAAGPVSSQEHYDSFLAPLYDWTQGGWKNKAHANRQVLEQVRQDLSQTKQLRAVDLGAGTGYQTIPLSQMGFEVVAVDSSASMLKQVRDRLTDTAALPVQLVVGDLLRFAEHLGGSVDLVACMTDTISHLPDRSSVSGLFADISRNLAPGGRVILSYRDMTTLPKGADRFIPVRSDPHKIFTCFLEEMSSDQVMVHDLLHTRSDDSDDFSLRVSSYLKLRLPEAWVTDELAVHGLEVLRRSEQFGLITLMAGHAAG